MMNTLRKTAIVTGASQGIGVVGVVRASRWSRLASMLSPTPGESAKPPR